MLAPPMGDDVEHSLRVLTVGTRFRADAVTDGEPLWPAVVDALRARGDAVTVLTTDEPGPALDGVERSLGWFRSADDSGWRRPPRMEASRIARHALLRFGRLGVQQKPDVVLWGPLGGLPLTLVGAAAVPEVALVLDGWPAYGPDADPGTRRGGWDPGAVAAWLCADDGLAVTTRAVGGVDPGRVVVAASVGAVLDTLTRVSVDPHRP